MTDQQTTTVRPVDHAGGLNPDQAATGAAANRAAIKYSHWEQLRRVIWSVGYLAFRFSPRPMFAWRRLVLRMFGATIGKAVHVYPTARLYMPWNVEIGDWSSIGEDVLIYSLGRVCIGRFVTLSYRSHVCAGSHDFSDPALPLTKPAVRIMDRAWIGTDAFIGPGVVVESDALVGARAVVVRDVAAGQIVGGNPARQIGFRIVPP
jgi:putative colanic acid biosynthesis acetyltransferase WcaF